MNFRNRVKHSGFSLMEILIAIFIVAILAMATMPVINRQLNKAEEYSYYLAYNTVEKLAGQIVALGDPEDTTSYNTPISDVIAKVNKEEQAKKYRAMNKKSNPISDLIATVGKKFTNTQAYILSHFTSKVIAAGTYEDVPRPFGEWLSDDYDYLWLAYQVCGNNRINEFSMSAGSHTETTIDPETGEEIEETVDTATHWGKQHFQNCIGYTTSGSYEGESYSAHDHIINDLFGDERSVLCAPNRTTLANAIKAQNGERPNAEAFCNSTYRTQCQGSRIYDGKTYNVSVNFNREENTGGEEIDEEDAEHLGEGEEYTEAPSSAEYGSCVISSTYRVYFSESDDSQYVPQKPTFGPSWCTDNGYTNMLNKGATETIDCQCATTNLEVSVNSEKVCVERCPNPNQLPYAKKNSSGEYNGTRECCSTDFNPDSNTCCPEKSLYDPSSTSSCKCTCVSGYEMNSSCSECVLKFCPAGSHKTDDGVCVVNPPITQAKRFCELITEHWNISDSYCGSFDSDPETHDIYDDVYNAALNKDGNNRFLSVNSKIGAFKSIKPNIEFANGLKLWILGDKAASIPGLSYYADNISKTQNMCFRKELTENTQIACYNAGGYFCKHENVCLVLDQDSKDSGAISDARTCCSTIDYSSLEAAATPGVDWKKDARAYAVAGFTVFVDIDGDKGDGTLWDDVYPFFIGSNGTVYPAYPLDAPKGADAPELLYDGGNSEKFLPVDVYYYLPTDEARKRMTAFSGVSYARGMCSARKVSKYAPYCLNLGLQFNGGDGFTSGNCPTSGGCTSSKKLTGVDYLDVDGKESRNPCDHYNCFVSVRKKLKSF